MAVALHNQTRIPREQSKRIMAMQPVQVSAPGKVLITGGYLVLDQQHPGLVLATTARFHTKIEVLGRTSKALTRKIDCLVGLACMQ